MSLTNVSDHAQIPAHDDAEGGMFARRAGLC